MPGDGTPVEKRWGAFLETFMHDRPNMGAFLSLATVIGSTESSIDLSYGPHLKFQFGEISKKASRDEIGKMLNTFMGRTVTLGITLEAGKPEKEVPNYISSVPHALAIESEIEHEPIIQAVLDIFDGEILK